MRHRKRGRKLGVNGSHRKAMTRNMVKSLIDCERIITTVPKAKQIQPFAEKVINLGKEKNLHNIRRVVKLLGAQANTNLQMEFIEDEADDSKKNIRTALQKLFDDIGPRNRSRNGGYTRILRLARRRVGDAGERCIFELVEGSQTVILGSDSKDEGKEESKNETREKEAVAS